MPIVCKHTTNRAGAVNPGRKEGETVRTYAFKISKSDLSEFTLHIPARNFEEAREKARVLCYKFGFCFEGRL